MEQNHSIEVRGKTLADLLAEAQRELSEYFAGHRWQVDVFFATAESVRLKDGAGDTVAMNVTEWVASVEASVPGLRLAG